MYHRDNPPSTSIHEEATNSTVIPFMPLFNNLVLYDQHKPQNSPQAIVPDLAKSWSWSADGRDLTFKLQDGVKWHDGQPFTAADVKCTWDTLAGTRATSSGMVGEIISERRARSLRIRGRLRPGICTMPLILRNWSTGTRRSRAKPYLAGISCC